MYGAPKNLLGANCQAFVNFSAIQRRNVSHHYLRPHPRSHKRRLFEAALAPVLPPDVEKERKLLSDNEFFELYKQPERDPSTSKNMSQRRTCRNEFEYFNKNARPIGAKVSKFVFVMHLFP